MDSSVLLDVLGADRVFGPASREGLRAAFNGGALIACDVIWAEVRAHFQDEADFEGAVRDLGLSFSPLSREAARLAGALWRQHHATSQRPRFRVVADFLIGAHAQTEADVLLTGDRGFFRGYFKDLKLRQPTAGQDRAAKSGNAARESWPRGGMLTSAS